MNLTVKNNTYWIDFENSKVFNEVNGQITGQMKDQEKINHILDIVNRVQKIRRIYKSKKLIK